jgi:hypothetical protein
MFSWEDHYAKGGRSGDPEDYKLSRPWKHDILKKYYNMGIDTIIDVGCGDLQFWNKMPPTKYIGIDISKTIVDKHNLMFDDKPFICSNASNKLDIHADVVICFDMLWHIIDDNEYIKILNNIKSYSNKYIFIYTWNSNPFNIGIINQIRSKLFGERIDDGGYQKYRNYLSLSKSIFEPEFELIEMCTNNTWKFGTMYIYRRKNED